MEELVTALAARLPAGAVVLKQRVSALERAGNGWRVATSDGNAFEADRVIVATESHATARLTRYLDPSLATLLEEISYASAATVSLGYRRADVPHPLDGFGFVVPRTEGKALLAGTFSSVKYPGRAPEGHVLIRAFLGGMLNAGRAAGGRRRADHARAGRATRGARHQRSAGPHAPAPLAGVDAAVPGGSSLTDRDDRAPGRGPAGPARWPAPPIAASASPTASAPARLPPRRPWHGDV